MNESLRKRMSAGFLALAFVVTGGTVGYFLIGNGRWSWLDCLYMTVITVTTVGYGEVLHDMDKLANARLFTIGLLVFGTGSIVYFASTITAFIVEGDLQNMLRQKRNAKRIARMKDHIVVCGAGSTGRHIVEEMLATGTPVIAIDTREPVLHELAQRFPQAEFSYLLGDATDDDVLSQAAIGTARGIVAALSSDKDNLYLVVSGRQANPKARIVARCTELAHVEKIRRAGADSVVSPNHIGGMRMVSEMLRPAVVRFLDEMVRDRRSTFRIEEVALGGGALVGKSLREAKIREHYGMTVLALRHNETRPWIYNPEAAEVLSIGMIMVVLGAAEQVKRLRHDCTP